MSERKLVGFVQMRWSANADVYEPVIEERAGGTYETFWRGDATFDSEEAHSALAEACRKHGLVEHPNGTEWSRPL